MTNWNSPEMRLQDAAKVEWHGHWASPWVGLCLDYAAEKGVQLENMTMRDRGEINEITGQPRMPAVMMTRDDGSLACLSESTRIIDLLDRSYPAPEYFVGWSADPVVRAQQRLIEHGVGAIHQQVLDVAGRELREQQQMPADLVNTLAEQATMLASMVALADTSTPFFFGDAPSVVDYQVFNVEPFNRFIRHGLMLGKHNRELFDQVAPKAPLLLLLGDCDFSKLHDIETPPQTEAYLAWRERVDDRREANGLRRGCIWQKLVKQVAGAY